MTKVRPATPQDRPRVVAMALRFYRETAYGRLGPEPTIEALEGLFNTLAQIGSVFVAEAGPWQLVGFLAVAALTHPITLERYADEIAWWVEPEQRGSGAGLQLLAAAETWADDQGLPFLKMVAPAGSHVAAVYERRGYHAVETAYCKRLGV